MDRRLIAWFVLAITLSSMLIIVQRQAQPYPIHADEWYAIYHHKVIESSEGLARHQEGFRVLIGAIDRFTPVHRIWIVLVLLQLALFGLASGLILTTRNIPIIYAPLPMLLAALIPTSNATFGIVFFVPFTLALTVGLFSLIHTPPRFSLLRIVPLTFAMLIHPVAAGITGAGLVSILWFSKRRSDRAVAIAIAALGLVAYLIISPTILINPVFEGIEQRPQALHLIVIAALASMLLTRIRWTLIPLGLLGAIYVLGTLSLPTIGIPYWRAVLALTLLAPTLALLAPKHRPIVALVLIVSALIGPHPAALTPIHDIPALEALPLENATLVSAPLHIALRIGAIHGVPVAASQYFVGGADDRHWRARIEAGSCEYGSIDAIVISTTYACDGWELHRADPISVYRRAPHAPREEYDS
jgi:hypothetical protein